MEKVKAIALMVSLGLGSVGAAQENEASLKGEKDQQNLLEDQSELLTYLKTSPKFGPAYKSRIESGEINVENLQWERLEDLPETADDSNCDTALINDVISSICAIDRTVYFDSSLIISSDYERWGPRIRIRIPPVKVDAPKVTVPRVKIPKIDFSGVDPKAAINRLAENGARQYRDQRGNNGNFDDCVTVVAAACAVAGASYGGPIGAGLGAGSGVAAARLACRVWYP